MKHLSTFLLFFLMCVVLVIEAAAQTRASVGAEVSGTFRDASGSSFSILALGKGKLRVAFAGVYAYKTAAGEDMANTGEASGQADIAGDTAIFKPDNMEQCTITLKFIPGGKLKVTQNGADSECGFGLNVSAAGFYKKVSSRKPKFDAP